MLVRRGKSVGNSVRKGIRNMKKDWTAYKKANNDLCRASGRRMAEFYSLFNEGDELKYRRMTQGKIYVGHVLEVSPVSPRLRIASVATGKVYWIDAYWLEE